MSFSSSDSDDFFDARQDLGSPKCPSSPMLIVDEEVNVHETGNSPSRLGGDLSLDHLIQSESDEAVVHVIEYDNQDGGEPEIEVFQSLTLVDDETSQSNVTDSSKVNDEKVNDNDAKPEEQVHKQTIELSSSTSVLTNATDTSDNSDAIKQENVASDLPMQSNDVINDKEATLLATRKSENNSENIKTETLTGKVEEKLRNISNENTQQPDIVASIKERPSDLPGVKPLQIHSSESGNITQHKHTHIPHPSPARPKRPPPPRPKAPPKRPPPPKSGPSIMKPYMSSVDDGLLTPNSTVDNITREFAAALNEGALRDEASLQTTNGIKVNREKSPLAKENYANGKDNQDKRSSMKSFQKTSSTTSCNSQIDEEKPWSEMTKSTVLRIDSSPGLEILSTVIVRNLDTGQTMPLSAAAEQVSQCLNPLALQIMSRTKEFNCASGGAEEQVTKPTTPQTPEFPEIPLEEDSISVASDEITIGADASSSRTFHDGSRKLRMKSKRLKQILGKSARRVKVAAGTQVERAVLKVKQSKGDAAHSESLNVSSDEEISDSMMNSSVKTKASSSNKGPYQYSHPKLVQDIAVHVGAVWSMKFSHCGRLLATAGQNNVIWVWVLKDYFSFFNDLRNKYDSKERGVVFATPPRSSMEPPSAHNMGQHKRDGSDGGGTLYGSDQVEDDEEEAPFRPLPFSSYVGHTADVLDLAWSKNYFTLSSSMDKTVRLWHVSQKECLCCFQHIDFVTAISFHPRDDRYFLSGSLDSKLRLWNIPEKKVALWNEVTPDSSSSTSSGTGGALITSVNFCENGKFAVCGTYDGRCLFYDTEHLKYHTQIHVRSSRGRNTKGHKITGIEPLPGEHKILVSSNDSRVRLYDLRDLSLTCKFKGLSNLSSQIKASFSHDNKYIICGSEDKSVYIWRTNLPQDVTKLSSFRRDRNDAWESIRAHDAVVTCAIFAPYPHLMVRNCEKTETGSRLSFMNSKKTGAENSYIISADFNGVIKVFANS